MIRTGTNYEGMQAANRALILQILANRSSCTRADLSRETGLTQAAISKIIGDMVAANIVLERGSVPGKKGRRSVRIELNPSQAKVIAVKIARKSYSLAVAWLSGMFLEERWHPVDVDATTPRQVMDSIKAEIRGFLSTYDDVKAIGVAVPGPFLSREGRIAIMSEVSGWNDINIHEEFSQAFSLPVAIEHDANAGALAEWFGNQRAGLRDQRTLVLFLASEGIGAGVVNDGEILRGDDGVAGEVGHMSIDMNGPRCSCGNRGCLELYCSALSFARFVKEDLKEHPESSLRKEKEITAETVFRHMRQGDAFAAGEVRKAGRYMGVGMANIVYLYNPSEIIITDIMTGGGQIMLDAIRREVADRTLKDLTRDLEIHYTVHKHDTILFGAGVVAVELLMQNPERLYEKQTAE